MPLDQWQGIVPTYDFVNPQPGVVSTFHLTPTQDRVRRHHAGPDRAAALAHYRTIEDQITAPGSSFYVETNLALQPDSTGLVSIPLSQADSTNVIGMVAGMIALAPSPSRRNRGLPGRGRHLRRRLGSGHAAAAVRHCGAVRHRARPQSDLAPEDQGHFPRPAQTVARRRYRGSFRRTVSTAIPARILSASSPRTSWSRSRR